MANKQISVFQPIYNPAKCIHSIVADYHQGHPKILPKPYFESMIFEKGGFGTGTRIRLQMRVMRRRQEFRAEVTEPEPGRVLVETDLENDSETIFTVAPQGVTES